MYRELMQRTGQDNQVDDQSVIFVIWSPGRDEKALGKVSGFREGPVNAKTLRNLADTSRVDRGRQTRR